MDSGGREIQIKNYTFLNKDYWIFHLSAFRWRLDTFLENF